MIRVSLLLLLALAGASWGGEKIAEPLGNQLGVMLQLENMLETCPHYDFGRREKEVARQFELLEEGGIRWARVGIPWELIESEKGRFNWSAADAVVKAADTHKVHLVWLVGNTAPWDSSNKEWNGVPLDLAQPQNNFTHFVHALVHRYGASVHHWEIRNEPNLRYMWAGTPEQYATYLTQSYRTIKGTDAGASVVFGGLGGGVGQQVKWFEEVAQILRKRGGPLPFDVACFHVYPGSCDTAGFKGKDAVARYMDASEKKIEQAMKAAGAEGMPVWCTEFDYPANPRLQPDDPDFGGGPGGQARLVKELFPYLVSGRPERKIFWASLLDDYNDEGFESVGLVKSDKNHDIGEPRASYLALKTLLVIPQP